MHAAVQPISGAMPTPVPQGQRVRVLQINKFWGADRGGVEAVLHAYAEGLISLGYPVEVLACRPWADPIRALGLVSSPPPGLKLCELPAPVVASMPCHPGFPSRMARHMELAGIVHFHIPFPMAEASVLTRPKRVPWVATFHAEVTRHPAWIRQFYRIVLQRFLGRMDRIIVSSPNMAEIPSLRPFAKRVEVIPFGCDVNLLQAPPALPEGSLPPRRGRPVVLFAGRLVAYKGVDILLRALPGLEADAWILGDGPERPRLERLARRLGLNERAQFLGYRPRDQLRAAMHRASLLVFPSVSRAETFGVVQMEALASGLPVINTFLPTGVNFVSPHGVTGWTVPLGDPAALHAAIHALLHDSALRQHFAREARMRAARLFDVRLQTQRLHELYQDVLGSPAIAN